MSARKPVRLDLLPERRDKRGWIKQNAVWIIRDGEKRVSTGCGPSQRAEAEKAFEAYLAERHKAKGPEQHRAAAEIPIADVLAHYAAGAEGIARPGELASRLGRLLDWWGDRRLSEVTGYTCKAYAKARGTDAGAGRELDDMKAAINLYVEDGLCREIVKVWTPTRPEARRDWLTVDQVVALLRHLRDHRLSQRGKATTRRNLRHIVPFVLVAIYTGSRSSRIWTASFEREPKRPWIDLEAGIFYRKGVAEARFDNKRADPIRIPDKLLRFLRFWQRGPLVDGVRTPRRYRVEYAGRPVNPKKGLNGAMVAVFGEDHPFVLHSFRHTCASWLIQDPDMDESEIAGFLSMSVPTLRRVYGHLHPDANRRVGEALGQRRAHRKRGRPRGHEYGRGAAAAE